MRDDWGVLHHRNETHRTLRWNLHYQSQKGALDPIGPFSINKKMPSFFNESNLSKMVWLPGVFILQDYIHGPSGIPVYHQDDIRFLTAQCDSGKLEATHFPTGNLGGSIPERTFTNLDFPERWELPFGGPGRVRSLWIIILDLFFVKHSLFTSTKTGTNILLVERQNQHDWNAGEAH